MFSRHEVILYDASDMTLTGGSILRVYVADLSLFVKITSFLLCGFDVDVDPCWNVGSAQPRTPVDTESWGCTWGAIQSQTTLFYFDRQNQSQFLYYVVNWLMTLCETLLCVFTPAQQVQCYDALAKTDSWTTPGLMYVYSSSTFWMSYVSWQYNIAEMPFKTKLGQKYKVLQGLHCNQ